jgi:hypothetical protein
MLDYVANKTGIFDSRPKVNIVNGVFPVVSISPDTYEVSYTLKNELGCERTVTRVIEVPEEADLDFDLSENLCQDTGEVNLLDHVNIKTGVFTFGDGLTVSPLWDVSKASAKDYEISYTIENGAGCPQTITNMIRVEASPSAPDFILPASICQNAPTINLYDLVEPKSGTFYSESPNFKNSPFDPSKMNIGSHTISYVLENEKGCQSTTTKNIEIGAGLTVDAGEDLTVCQDFPVADLKGLPVGGKWSGIGVNGDQFIGASLSAGTYQGTYTYANDGCEKSDNILITVIDGLPMDFTADKTDIVQGEKVTFSTDTQAEQYLWKVEGNSFEYEGTAPSFYLYADHDEAEKYFDVTLIAFIGNCSWELKKEGYIHLQKEASDGIITSTDDPQENAIAIYPNPFEEQLQIDLPVDSSYDVAVYDISGQLVHMQSMGKTGILNLRLLSAGLYMLKIQDNDIVKTFKIQKK